MGVLIAVAALWYWRSGIEFREQGVTTQAIVISKQRYRYGHILMLQFADLSGKPRTVEIRQRSTRAGLINKGAKVPVTYVPAHPEKAELGMKWGAQLAGWLALLAALFGAGMAVWGLSRVFGLLAGTIRPEEI